ncbi:unnamed protein product [Rotaria sordida]|uniref:Sulphur transport domain-containing protein n=1 Tax=Rotaria sordida TaxID=392033 RepID=A0A818M350_9BILA|nr:unnamed protein product [Rotaria sordida]
MDSSSPSSSSSSSDIDKQVKDKMTLEGTIDMENIKMLPLKEKNFNNNNDTSKFDVVPSNEKISHDNRDIFSDIRTILYAIIFGILFGFFMNKGTVFVAPTIRKQMLFQRFAMLKMFLAAVGTSMLSVALLTLCCRKLYEKILNGYIEHNSRRGILHYLFGGTLIGLGMIICGSCLGTVFVQVGSGIVNSLFTCLSGLLGTYFYYIFVHERVSLEKLSSSSLVLRRICDLFHIHSVIVHIVFGLILLGISIGLEFIIPWKSDLNPSLFIKRISSAFTVFAAQICRIKKISQSLPSLNSFAYELKNHVSLLFALGAIGGSALSSSLSRTIPLGAENGTNILSSILGGFLLLLGA